MTLTSDDLQHLAHISRLRFTADEIGLYQSQIENILAYVDQLKTVEIGTDGESRERSTAATRPDNVIVDRKTEELLANAPELFEGHVRVQAVFEDQ